MRYYPIQLDICNRPCLVVGGGAVGTRKVSTAARLRGPGHRGEPRGDRRASPGDRAGPDHAQRCGNTQAATCEGMFLVIGATDDEDLNRRVSADAEQPQILCNIADRPDKCNFILPAVIARGDLVITVSTSGKSPALAKKLRRDTRAAVRGGIHGPSQASGRRPQAAAGRGACAGGAQTAVREDRRQRYPGTHPCRADARRSTVCSRMCLATGSARRTCSGKRINPHPRQPWKQPSFSAYSPT